MANTKTKGRITLGGQGKSSVKVKVFDQEYLLGIPTISTELGRDYTNNDGDYSVSYSADSYGGYIFDEDRGETRPGSIIPPRAPEYGPMKPDIYIEVWDGDARIHTSDVIKNVTDDTCTIDVSLPSDPEAERNLFENAVDVIVDLVVTAADAGGDLIEAGSDAVGDILDSVFGEGAGDGIRKRGRTLAAMIRDGSTIVQNWWDTNSNRTISMPEDLWQACQERYRNYKRDILLRHFFPPENPPDIGDFKRLIPFLVSSGNKIGRVDINKTPFCSDKDRYGKEERFPLGPLSKPEGITGLWTNDQWRSHLRRNGDVYCRSYENGLATTGSFIACLAYEYGLAGSDNSYRQETEGLISLALDTIEDLERCTKSEGYIIRYHEDGDCSQFIIDGDVLCNLPLGSYDESQDSYENVIALESYSVPTCLLDYLQNERGVIVDDSSLVSLRKCPLDGVWLLVINNKAFMINHDQDLAQLLVYRARTKSCGFPDDGSYCLPVTGQLPEKFDENGKPRDEWKKYDRQRKYEPSGDEYVHLLEGLAVALRQLPQSSQVYSRTKKLLFKIYNYLVHNSFFLIRPCGNFTFRGPATVVYEYPLSCLFRWSLNMNPSDSSTIPDENVFEVAGISSLDEVQVSEQLEFETIFRMLRHLPALNRFRMFFAGAVLPYIEIDINNPFSDILTLITGERPPINLITIPIGPLVQCWTLHMISKACQLGLGGAENDQQNLKEIYRTWFDTVGDRQFRKVRGDRGHSYHPITLAVAIALLGRKTNAVWQKLRLFFDRNPDATNEHINGSETEVDPDGKTGRLNEPEFPIDHLKMELNHIANVNSMPSDSTIEEKPCAIGEESAMDCVLEAMWPIATIAYATGRPLKASISDFSEEPGMPTNQQIRERLINALRRG